VTIVKTRLLISNMCPGSECHSRSLTDNLTSMTSAHERDSATHSLPVAWAGAARRQHNLDEIEP
jgi:hypothetical protein